MLGTKAATHRIILIVAALVVVGIVIWLGKRVLEPVAVPLVEPAKARITFNLESDIRNNSLFDALKAFILGDLETGVLGNPRPFINPDTEMRLETGQQSRLATMEEISLQGAFARDIAPGSDGSMLVLLSGAPDSKTASYEIRSYASNGSAETFANWQDATELERTPSAMVQGHDGTVWLGSAFGGVGSVKRGGQPEWRSNVLTGLEGPVSSMAVDYIDHVWMTDGIHLSVGGDEGFSPVDLFQQLSDSNRETFIASITDLNASYSGAELGYIANEPERALQPERLSVTREGRLGVTTGLTAFRFTLDLQTRPEWINTLAASSTLPLIVGQNGAVWGRRLEDGVLTRVWATGTRAYTSTLAAPSYALSNPNLFTLDASKLYAVDYAPASTSVLWSTTGEDWFSQLIVASGTPSLDTPIKAEADRDGNLWLLMKQGGLVRIRQSQSL